MSVLALTGPSERIGSGLIQRARARFDDWLRSRQRRKAISDISQLDDHVLRDIGISRADIQDALDGRGGSVLFERFRANDY
ncbi:DUF1127 domain-containing protein [Devosia sp.]|uniref:DUF1127 domain-containing protein n=1 Tax=Devosia sp. TaxID=1871048 RepID=UPI003A8E4515